MPEQIPLIDPWEIAKNIASWLPFHDEVIALRIINEHQSRHATAEKR